MDIQQTSFEEILGLKPRAFADLITGNFTVTLPNQIETISEMREAGPLLLILSNQISYLNALLGYAKIKARDTKRFGIKSEAEDLLDKHNHLEKALDSVKQGYIGLSRAITVRTEINKELMLCGDDSLSVISSSQKTSSHLPLSNEELVVFDDVLQKPVLDFANWMNETFLITLPQTIDTIDDMRDAGRLLLGLSNQITYLNILHGYGKIIIRHQKRYGTKVIAEDMIDKVNMVEHSLDSIKQSYSGLSRAITVRTEINKELEMYDNRLNLTQ